MTAVTQMLPFIDKFKRDEVSDHLYDLYEWCGLLLGEMIEYVMVLLKEPK